ncbi:hypothetical protein AVEN_55516-1 [Araneus ventricosus]|uniref:Uncharacterized protein n=1 Tax=Araneus ventricosus TaxID=182803 RepID=A0A4Y2C9G5_ARAVE|nr:hypothetical protein AVEN_55516-1 [Araneus ventricosus]
MKLLLKRGPRWTSGKAPTSGRRAPGPKPDSTVDPPCMGPAASQIIRSGPPADAVRKLGDGDEPRCRPRHLSAVQNLEKPLQQDASSASGGTLKPPSPGLEHVDVINEDLNDINEQELEQKEVQNLLTIPEPIHDVQLQLVGYKQEKDDKGKKRSLNICPTTPKRVKSIHDEKNDSIFTDNSLESYESHKITQQLINRSYSIQDIKMKLQNIQRAVQGHLYFAVSYEQDQFYIGKIKKIEGEDILMTFLEKSAGNFRWPKRHQKEKVNIKFIFYGSVQLYGNNPFLCTLIK